MENLWPFFYRMHIDLYVCIVEEIRLLNKSLITGLRAFSSIDRNFVRWVCATKQLLPPGRFLISVCMRGFRLFMDGPRKSFSCSFIHLFVHLCVLDQAIS